jgi:hypothetical protein
MRFRNFYLFTEADPAGGAPPGMPPAGGPPGMGPAPGMPPAGGGMGGDPMGGGMGAPPGGMGGPGAAGPQPTVPAHADVWEVLEAILGNKPVKPQQQVPSGSGGPPPGGDPMGGMGGMPPMGGPPPGMGQPGPMGTGMSQPPGGSPLMM